MNKYVVAIVDEFCRSVEMISVEAWSEFDAVVLALVNDYDAETLESLVEYMKNDGILIGVHEVE